MITGAQAFIFVPDRRYPHVNSEIIRADSTTDTIKTVISQADFSRIATNGIGSFNVKIKNGDGYYSGRYAGGDTIKFYADRVDGTKKQFEGRIDYVKEERSDNGRYIGLEGRHISWQVTEKFVNYTISATDGATVLKTLISNFLPAEFSVNTSYIADPIGTSINVNYANKTFWTCVIDICDKCSADCYIDDNKAFHFFITVL